MASPDFAMTLSQLQAEYERDVQYYAKQAIVEYESGNYDDIGEAIYETVDGCTWVVYTGNNLLVLLFSSNDQEIANIDSSLDIRDGIPYMQMAYYALRADVAQAVYDIQSDLSDASDSLICTKCEEPHLERYDRCWDRNADSLYLEPGESCDILTIDDQTVLSVERNENGYYALVSINERKALDPVHDDLAPWIYDWAERYAKREVQVFE